MVESRFSEIKFSGNLQSSGFFTKNNVLFTITYIYSNYDIFDNCFRRPQYIVALNQECTELS